MRRVGIAALCVVALGVTLESAHERPVPEAVPDSPMVQHLRRAIALVDHGDRSQEYRESIAYLTAHAPHVVSAVGETLRRGKGSFQKWQIAYLLGEVGDGDAIPVLHGWIVQSLPTPDPVRDAEHQVDLSYAEEISARAQAVSSMARIAVRQPELHARVVSALVTIAEESVAFRAAARFELRGLLGERFEELQQPAPASSVTGGYTFAIDFEEERRVIRIEGSPDQDTECMTTSLPAGPPAAWRRAELDPARHARLLGLLFDEERVAQYEADTAVTERTDVLICITHADGSEVCYQSRAVVTGVDSPWRLGLHEDVSLSDASKELIDAFESAHEICWNAESRSSR